MLPTTLCPSRQLQALNDGRREVLLESRVNAIFTERTHLLYAIVLSIPFWAISTCRLTIRVRLYDKANIKYTLQHQGAFFGRPLYRDQQRVPCEEISTVQS